jgi:hypothetical protein
MSACCNTHTWGRAAASFSLRHWCRQHSAGGSMSRTDVGKRNDCMAGTPTGAGLWCQPRVQFRSHSFTSMLSRCRAGQGSRAACSHWEQLFLLYYAFFSESSMDEGVFVMNSSNEEEKG